MTPEDRATNVMSIISTGCHHDTCKGFTLPGCSCFSAIASAIREAEREALERAALVADARHQRDMQFATAYEERGRTSDMIERVSGAVSAKMIAEQIRSLRHQPEGDAA